MPKSVYSAPKTHHAPLRCEYQKQERIGPTLFPFEAETPIHQNMLTGPFLTRLWRICGALLVATGTIMGALTAHLPDAHFAEGGRAIARSAMEMQMWQGLALVALGLGLTQRPNRLLLCGGCGVLVGTLLFCAGVYDTAFTGHHGSHIAPSGGSLLIASWLALAIGWMRRA